jgi:hypothetical protein
VTEWLVSEPAFRSQARATTRGKLFPQYELQVETSVPTSIQGPFFGSSGFGVGDSGVPERSFGPRTVATSPLNPHQRTLLRRTGARALPPAKFWSIPYGALSSEAHPKPGTTSETYCDLIG